MFYELVVDELPLRIREGGYFQLDGEPPHFVSRVTRHLTKLFALRWIGRCAPLQWPRKSPDLTLCDFWLWGTLPTSIRIYLELLERSNHEVHTTHIRCRYSLRAYLARRNPSGSSCVFDSEHGRLEFDYILII
jgi:hypothetical protein